MTSDPNEQAASRSAPAEAFVPASAEMAIPASWPLLHLWLKLGVQSFGGGAATLTLIRRAVVAQQRWLTEDEFSRQWALCQLAPGINLLALTVLIGQRVAGWRGILLSLLGLLLPSVTITILLTAGYRRIEHLASIQAALHGVIPATVGLGLVTAVQMAQPPLREGQKEGHASLSLGLAILIGSGLAATARASALLILFAAAALHALAQWLRQRQLTRTQGAT